jgi:hypothetical protein
LISLVASFTWNSSFWSWSFSTFFSFFNGFILFRGTFASVWFSQIWWFVFRLLLFFFRTAHSFTTAGIFSTTTGLRWLWLLDLKSLIIRAEVLNRLTQFLPIWSNRTFAAIPSTNWNLTRLNFIRSIFVAVIFVCDFVIASLFVWDIGKYTRWLLSASSSTVATLRISSLRCQLWVVFIFHRLFLFLNNFGSIFVILMLKILNSIKN